MKMPVTGEVLVRLKTETQALHLAMERALNLTHPSLTLPAYRTYLEKFLGFYRPVEGSLLAIGGWRERGLDLEARRKVPLLEADLRILGAEPERLLPCEAPPRLATPAEAFGCLYVVEGATLGGTIIYRHVQQVLGLAAETGARFFYGYGNENGPMWRSFGAALRAYATTSALEDAIVRSAVETFDRLHQWFIQGDPA